MNISYTQTSSVKLIKVTSPEIATFIGNLSSYTGIEVIANHTCDLNNIDSGTINTTDIVDTTKSIYVADTSLYITPSFLSLLDLIDDIYNIQVRLITNTGYIQITNCAFLDISYKCKVANLLKELIIETDLPDGEKVSTFVHILHYSLINGSNCGCNCGELCTIFSQLSDILNVTIQDNDCGCK